MVYQDLGETFIKGYDCKKLILDTLTTALIYFRFCLISPRSSLSEIVVILGNLNSFLIFKCYAKINLRKRGELKPHRFAQMYVFLSLIPKNQLINIDKKPLDYYNRYSR